MNAFCEGRTSEGSIARVRISASPLAARSSGPRLSAIGHVEPSDARDAVASLFAASRQNFLPALGLHSRAKAMLLVSPPDMRLKRTLYQAIFSLKNH